MLAAAVLPSSGTESLFATVTHIEPGKLLRVSGSIGLTHLPVTSVCIFELQPKHNGRTTLLRLGHENLDAIEATIGDFAIECETRRSVALRSYW